MRPPTRYARGPHGDVAYQIFGTGPIHLVFVMNWRTNLEILWDEPTLVRFLGRLATFSRVICFDKRGSGLSERLSLSALPTLEEWMDDVRLIIDAVGCERVVLLGDTEGGPMAMLFTATYPERTRALVLVNTFARLVRDDDYPWGYPKEVLPAFLERTEREWGTGAALDNTAPSAAHDPRLRSWVARSERLAVTPHAFRLSYAWVLELDVRAALPAIRTPTLVLHRAGSRHIRVSHGRYLAEQIPGARYVELPGEDSVFHVGDPDDLLNEIEEFLTGVRHEAPPDRMLATLLFTDIVGSTERAADLGDRRWREILDEHDAVTAEGIERFGGRLIDRTGDALMATFDGPARAVRCACAMRDEVRALGIDVRIGLHTGEVEVRGSLLGGIAVHIGARVEAAAAPGEILVSRTVRDLVVGSGLLFEDRGTRTLKGVPEPWQLYAVLGDDRASN